MVVTADAMQTEDEQGMGVWVGLMSLRHSFHIEAAGCTRMHGPEVPLDGMRQRHGATGPSRCPLRRRVGAYVLPFWCFRLTRLPFPPSGSSFWFDWTTSATRPRRTSIGGRYARLAGVSRSTARTSVTAPPFRGPCRHNRQLICRSPPNGHVLLPGQRLPKLVD